MSAGSPAHGLNCPQGTVLFRADDACKGFVMVHSGRIRVSLTSRTGREVTLYRVGPGDICLQTFSCLVEGRRYAAEGVVEADLVAELIPPDEFRERLASDDAFRDSILKAVAHRFSDFEQLVEDVALSGLEARLARALLRLADPQGHVAVTHEALAVEVASGRAVISRTLGELASRGWVALHRGEIEILKPEALKRAAD
ncbi:MULTISPECIES: Crp/Fnr family transcriptional regulator [Hyphobacterium]|uniref:Crp/Fnr family transcriptional regulator n=1 Tax=Hyphobacterium vulgare TaxID=1736751 RepID=A0ABV7A0A0_9PROT